MTSHHHHVTPINNGNGSSSMEESQPLLSASTSTSSVTRGPTHIQEHQPPQHTTHWKRENGQNNEDAEQHKHQQDKGDSSEFTLTLLLLTVCAGFGGTLFGYDTSVISGALLLLEKEFSLSDIQKEVIVSLTVGGAFVGSLGAGLLSARWGRKPAIVAGSIVFMAGAAILALAQGWRILALGRFVVGLGVGVACATVPMYISECAPSRLRGPLTVVSSVCIATGQCLANVVDALFSKVPQGWRYMFAVSAAPALLQFIGFFFLPESPRFLVAKGERPRAGLVLRRLRGKQYNAEPELDAMEATSGEPQGGLSAMLAKPHLRRILFLGCMLQGINQLTAINTVMYYTGTILKMSGITDDTRAMWISAAVTAVFSSFTALGLFLVERVGRRPLLLASLVGVFVSLLLLAQAFFYAEHHAPRANATLSDPSCMYADCITCLKHHHCGFCTSTTSSSTSDSAAGGGGGGRGGAAAAAVLDGIFSTSWDTGACLANTNTSLVPVACGGAPVANSTTATTSISTLPAAPDAATAGAGQWFAARGSAAVSNVCPSTNSWLTIIAMCLYLALYGIGVASLPWTINSEIFPTHVRSAGTSYASAVNWLCNLGVSLSFLSLANTITRAGTFYLYAAVAFLSVLYIYFALPETKGKSLEEIEALFLHEQRSRRCLPCGRWREQGSGESGSTCVTASDRAKLLSSSTLHGEVEGPEIK